MPEANQDLGRAVEEVLEWLGTSPDAAAAAVGINASTLNAMRQGIVPMRSLVLRFAQGIAGRCGEREGAQDWWTDPDAWLARAGYLPRRDGPGPGGPRTQDPPLPEPPPDRPTQRQFAQPRPHSEPAASDEPPAGEFYKPVYERQPWGETFVHVFWIENPEGQRVFRRHMNPHVDYKAEAVRLKHDLATLPRSVFERKYGRFRVQERE